MLSLVSAGQIPLQCAGLYWVLPWATPARPAANRFTVARGNTLASWFLFTATGTMNRFPRLLGEFAFFGRIVVGDLYRPVTALLDPQADARQVNAVGLRFIAEPAQEADGIMEGVVRVLAGSDLPLQFVQQRLLPVSYTHLTLPTICSV